MNLAKSSDVAIVFANYGESEGSDISNIDLPGNRNQLISSVAAANPKTVVVLDTGSAVTMPWLGQVAGVFENWYPGQEAGNAIAALLFGDVNPSGKLPVTFPASLADVPAHTTAQWPGANSQVQYSEGVRVGYRWYDVQNVTPLHPFRVTLAAGQSRTVQFTVGSHDLAHWADSAGGWTTTAGAYQILVGDSSRNLPLTGSVTAP